MAPLDLANYFLADQKTLNDAAAPTPLSGVADPRDTSRDSRLKDQSQEKQAGKLGSFLKEVARDLSGSWDPAFDQTSARRG